MTTRLSCSIALTATCGLFMACAKPLPELPVYADPIASLPPIAEQYPSADSSITHASNIDALTYVANDLVDGLSYISRIAPNLTSINAPTANTEFDGLVTSALRSKGYSIDDRSYRGSNEQLTTAYLQKRNRNDVFELTGIISIDDVLLKRVYAVQGNAIEPVTTYMVRGVTAETVATNGNIQSL